MSENFHLVIPGTTHISIQDLLFFHVAFLVVTKCQRSLCPSGSFKLETKKIRTIALQHTLERVMIIMFFSNGLLIILRMAFSFWHILSSSESGWVDEAQRPASMYSRWGWCRRHITGDAQCCAPLLSNPREGPCIYQKWEVTAEDYQSKWKQCK